MGFSYRKSFKAGPVRVTASKSGISYSAGTKGARVTRRASGRVQTTLSVPGTGVRYTATSQRPAAARMPANAIPYTVVADRYQWVGEPARFKGFGFRRIRLYPDRVEIRRMLFRTVIPAHDIVEVRAGAPSMKVHGYLWFVIAEDPIALTAHGQGANGIALNRHVILFNTFRPSRRRTWQYLVDLLGQR